MVVPQARYAEFLRGEWCLAEYASRTIHVAAWYVEESSTNGAPRVVNETYSILQLDGLGQRRKKAPGKRGCGRARGNLMR